MAKGKPVFRLKGPDMTDLDREKANFAAWKRRVEFKEKQWKARIAAMKQKRDK